jgi:hypothetical protein
MAPRLMVGHHTAAHTFRIIHPPERLTMNTRLAISLKSTLLVAALLALPAAQAMTKAEYDSGKDLIASNYKLDRSTCDSLAHNAKDICKEEVAAKRNSAKAELVYAYSGKAADRTRVQVVKADGAYAIAKEKCDDLAGNDKSVCVKEAKAVQTKALVDARMSKDIRETRKDGAMDKADADYNVALQKCDALSGDAKSACVAAAKSQFGKT